MDIKRQIKAVLKENPKLLFNEDLNEFSGLLAVGDNDEYDVKIVLNDFPKSFPMVFEIGERIPCKVDRHIYEFSGSCCLTTSAKESILLKSKIQTISDFIDLMVIPYFQNNSYYELNKSYVSGEYSHDVIGILEAYAEILRINTLHVSKVTHFITQTIEMRIEGKELSVSDSCYCGSGISFYKCSNGIHKRAYSDFKKIDLAILSFDLYKKINPFLREMELFMNMKS